MKSNLNMLGLSLTITFNYSDSFVKESIDDIWRMSVDMDDILINRYTIDSDI